MARYCFVVTIIAGDTGNELRDLFGIGVPGLKDYISGDDATGWKLSFGGNVVTQGVDKNGIPIPVEACAVIAMNSDVAAGVKTRIGQMMNARPGLGRQILFNPPITRAAMVPRLQAEVGSESGADHYWHSKANDDVLTGIVDAASLLAKFSPLG